jgi:hypothetical protein
MKCFSKKYVKEEETSTTTTAPLSSAQTLVFNSGKEKKINRGFTWKEPSLVEGGVADVGETHSFFSFLLLLLHLYPDVLRV